MLNKIILMLALSSSAAFCQQVPPVPPTSVANPPVTSPTEVIVVTESFLPVPLSENDRSVESLDTRPDSLLFANTSDYLRLDPDIDLRQRAGPGVQTDLSSLGSTFGETLVLLNGLRLNDAQTAHHNMDVPIPLDAISRIEVLHGAGSTFYGADAMGGGSRFHYPPAKSAEFHLLAGMGNQGFDQQHIFGSFFDQELVGNRRCRSRFLQRVPSRPRLPQQHRFIGHPPQVILGHDRCPAGRE
jgi:hypothetical protein